MRTSRRRPTFLIVLVLLGLAIVLPATSGRRVPPEQTFQRALEALRRGDIETVSQAILALQDDPAFDSHVRLLRAGRLLRTGQPSAALKLLSERNPEGEVRGPALLVIAESLYRLGRLAEVEAVVRKLVEEEPESPDAHRWLAAVYYDLGANQSAMDELRVVIRLDRDDYRPWHLLGQIDFDAERYVEAIESCREALARRPPAPQHRAIIAMLARGLVKIGRYESALEVLSDAEPEASLLALESECHWSLGRPERAAAILARAERIDPEERLVLLMKARLEMEAGRPEAALAPLQRQLERDPHDFECRYGLALACRRLGRLDDYRTELRRMQQSQALQQRLTDLSDMAIMRPRDADVRDQIAALYEELGRPKLAAVYRQAAETCRQASILNLSAANE